MDFERNSEGKVELVARTKRLADLRGILAYEGRPLTDQDLVALVAEARHWRATKLRKNTGA